MQGGLCVPRHRIGPPPSAPTVYCSSYPPHSHLAPWFYLSSPCAFDPRLPPGVAPAGPKPPSVRPSPSPQTSSPQAQLPPHLWLSPPHKPDPGRDQPHLSPVLWAGRDRATGPAGGGEWGGGGLRSGGPSKPLGQGLQTPAPPSPSLQRTEVENQEGPSEQAP